MTTRGRTRAAVATGVLVLSALAGCGGGGGSEESAGTSSGPPPCSDYANGEVIPEELSLSGCTGDGVTVNNVTSCDGHTLFAVGPVYGFVGKPANYLGDGEDATKSPEWEAFKQECPYDSE